MAIAIDNTPVPLEKNRLKTLSEVQGIMEQYRDYKIKIWCFDTEVHNEQDFSCEGDLESYEIQGGGGTDFDVILNT